MNEFDDEAWANLTVGAERMSVTKWAGLSWGTLGDSITEANGYQPLVAESLGFARVVNYGKGGCPVTAGGERDYGATVNMAREADPTLDCVTIFAVHCLPMTVCIRTKPGIAGLLRWP